MSQTTFEQVTHDGIALGVEERAGVTEVFSQAAFTTSLLLANGEPLIVQPSLQISYEQLSSSRRVYSTIVFPMCPGDRQAESVEYSLRLHQLHIYLPDSIHRGFLSEVVSEDHLKALQAIVAYTSQSLRPELFTKFAGIEAIWQDLTSSHFLICSSTWGEIDQQSLTESQ
jgi:hypothetical protein